MKSIRYAAYLLIFISFLRKIHRKMRRTRPPATYNISPDTVSELLGRMTDKPRPDPVKIILHTELGDAAIAKCYGVAIARRMTAALYDLGIRTRKERADKSSMSEQELANLEFYRVLILGQILAILEQNGMDGLYGKVVEAAYEAGMR